MARDPFAHALRNSAAYRADRLEEERERLYRRLKWALHRGDERAVAWLERRIEELDTDLADKIAPGKARGRHDRYRSNR
ncbi:hypothetical protein [Halomonas urumqiensis]|uniref:Uncharacterized protein n=1 Tax=Halomonas urumqiensis TaxID=1684789 RepID=A0A2N7UF77_9GAMM|nr:hypothetical protein [Halomonas urumqiensis]PMR79096.1 hypothetical protein C1H70_12370 [Halomonas urumqiensis]PTB03770.1 hypothetical protein C6V82_04655 [Halomonas urumqiensis]GHE20003.1 hypothetical protein GCM10017767_05240 [Halomonas urumqiensis]